MDSTDSTGTIDTKATLWCPIMPENLWFPAGPRMPVVPNGAEQTIQALLYTMDTTDTTDWHNRHYRHPFVLEELLVSTAAHIAYLGTIGYDTYHRQCGHLLASNGAGRICGANYVCSVAMV